MPKDKGTKTGFCQGFDWNLKGIQWLDKTGLYALSKGRVVRIDLESNGVSGQFGGFLVTIINPTTGKIDAKFFDFNDYLSERSDDRQKDMPDQRFEVISHTGWKWYIAVPKSTRALCLAIETYIGAFT